MPRDFRTFAKENENILNKNKVKTEEYEDILNKYKDMNSSDLMTNLFKEASKLKQEGKLDSNTLSNLKSTLAPFLNNEQKEMLNSLVKAIDEQT